MCLRNTETRYGAVAQLFHWGMFLLIAGMLAVGFIMAAMPLGPAKISLIGTHKSIGVLILLLVFLRLLWRAASVAPTPSAALSRALQAAARATHAALYALMILMPLSGWLMSSAAGFPVSFFGWFTLPDLIGPDKAWRDALRTTHFWLAWALIALAALHIAAALYHHFVLRDDTLRRMLPSWRK